MQTIINPEIIMMAFSIGIFIIISFYSFRISRMKKKNLILFLPKPEEFKKDLKYLLLASIFAVLWISLIVGYFFITSDVYFPYFLMVIEAVFAIIAMTFLALVFVRWGKRIKVV